MSWSTIKKKRMMLALSAAVMLTTALPAGTYAETPDFPKMISSESVSSPVQEGPLSVKGDSPVDAKISKEKAARLSKEYVSIPDDYVLQGASFTNEMLAQGKRSLWNLTFVKRVNNEQRGNIQTRIDAENGRLLGLGTYFNDPARKPVYPPKVDREQAKELALAFIGQVSPQYKDQLRYNDDYGTEFRPPLQGEVRYPIRYNRVVGDVAYMDNFISLELDGEGHVMQYEVRWDETVQFEPAGNVITMEEAVLRFRAEAEPELVYQVPYNMKSPRTPMLSYEMPPFMLAASDGSVWNPQSGQLLPNKTIPVSSTPLGAKPAGGKNLTAEQAAELAAAAFLIPEQAVLRDSSYTEYNDEGTGSSQAMWNLSWEVKPEGDDAGSYSIWAAVDSRSGMIHNFSAYKPADQVNQGTSYEQARSKAVELVKKQLPGYAHELYLQNDDASRYEGKKPGEVGSYSFQFVRRVNGARVDYESVYINVNAGDGSIQSYYAEFSAYAYPAQAPAVIGKAKAIDAFMDYYKVELTYVLPVYWDGQPIPIEKYNLMVASGEIPPGGTGDGQESAKAKLVYRLVERPLDEPVFLGAESGEWHNRTTGEVTELVKRQATDIEGHWAARELSLMVAYKALDLEDGKVRPNEIVTRGGLIKMLVLAMNSGHRPIPYATRESASFNDVAADSAYFIYVESAVEQNLIDRGDGSFDPEGKVDREEMAELIVRALGYNTLAEREDMFNIPFKDAASFDKKGQAAIVAGLKIMNANAQGNFMPQRQVTRAEASAAFFRFLQVKAELQEAPLRN
ncbi:S-layer homology domain-containing protein [Paenibacillus abyssi]|uniref:SLH domain-containing protein n=1 Tax=Paenibacillus abyssi TaxID=1340531 RepID=A0A917CND2_9BACL|nr:S-layer homology domain-containing protein [Paenibacillus abyssi]GGF92058.1 hypothetical protein GCM10010916_06760 [Paenibacillus abyssi]